AQESEQARGLFGGMSGRVRCAVALVAGAGVGSLLLGVLSPRLDLPQGVAEAAASWTGPLVASSVVVLLAILHRHATGCRACGKWWSGMVLRRELVGGEASGKDGSPFGRSRDRTTYRCPGCRHSWSVTETEGHRESAWDRPHRHGG